MAKKKNAVAENVATNSKQDEILVDDKNSSSHDAQESEKPKNPWMAYFDAVTSGTDEEIRITFADRAKDLISSHPIMAGYHLVTILEPNNSIDDHDLNKVYESLKKNVGAGQKDVLLLILSRGGSIEPAYQISKLCKHFSANKFVVTVPRYAKSAATLIALGADEIHMGLLGQLGPIDPQLGGLPALGVSQAIRGIGKIAQDIPGSSEMLASYLKQVLTIEQVGYCDRIAESAVQYAQRLLATKPFMKENRIQSIASKFVHEYKDHGFVIDQSEALTVLGNEWVKTSSDEIAFAEAFYSFYDSTNSFLQWQSKELLVLGDIESGQMVLNRKK